MPDERRGKPEFNGRSNRDLMIEIVELLTHNLRRLARIEFQLNISIQGEGTIMADLAGLQAEVARNTTVEASALALIQGFAAQLAAAGTDPAALQALQDQLTQNDNALAAAVAANTPASGTAGTPAETPAA